MRRYKCYHYVTCKRGKHAVNCSVINARREVDSDAMPLWVMWQYLAAYQRHGMEWPQGESSNGSTILSVRKWSFSKAFSNSKCGD